MKGIYLLFFKIKGNTTARIGKLGKVLLRRGSYVYVGSAQNGIRQRVLRHLGKNKKKHWHIDYLLANKNVKIESVFYRETRKKSDECKTAEKFMKNSRIIKGFGCSDCRCRSHLFRLK